MLTTLLLLMQPLHAEELTLQSVLDSYRQAIGGVAAIEQVRSVYVQGRTLATENSAEMQFKAWYEPRHNHLRLEYLYLGVPGVISYDGERGWNVLPVISNRQPIPMQGADLLQIREQADFFGPLIRPEDNNLKLTLLSPQQSADGQLQRIEVRRSYTLPQPATVQDDSAAATTETESVVETSIWKISSSNWLPQVVTSEDRLPDGSQRTLTVRYSDYRKVVGEPGQAGIVWPHRVETDDGVGELQINVLDEIKLNVALDQVRFDLSDDSR
jgi:hypothetical protein